MHTATKRSIEALANRANLQAACSETSTGNQIARLVEEFKYPSSDNEWSQYRQTVAQAVQLDDGRWVSAYEKNGQWRGSDKPDAPQGYSYSFANYPEGLDVRNYRSAVDCLRSALRATGMPI